jgi:hypothetical protein
MIQARLLKIHGFSNILHGGAMKSLLTKHLCSSFKDVISGHAVLPTERLVGKL